MSGAEDSKTKWTFSQRFISGVIARASVRSTLAYRITPRMQAGVEVNPRAEKGSAKVGPLFNALLAPETLKRPAVILGTSSDRIGTPHGQAFYVTASKNLKRETKLPIAPYGGMVYGTYEDRFRAIGGLNIGFTEQLTALIVFDGSHVHPLLNFSYKQHTFSFILVRGKHPGASYSIAF
ncbi:MAG: hypothetical protein ACRD8O_21055 [Bryobacteraceae bacterium]